MQQSVLVVDDDPLTRRVLQHYLARAGYQVFSANNGCDAIKLANSKLPQLIILDVMMPDMDGWTALKQIQQTEPGKSIPVILLSGNADLVAKENPSHSGAAALLVKPVRAEQLLTVIRQLMPGPGPDGAADKPPE